MRATANREARPRRGLVSSFFGPLAGLLAALPAVASEGGDFAAARAVIEARCLGCHGGAHRESGFSFADAATFERGGARGPVVDRENLSASRILEVVRYGNPDLAMPPSGMIPEAERATLEAWVLAGAPWPEGDAGRLADPAAHPLEEHTTEVRPWWAYDPLVVPKTPITADATWSAHPADAFLLARMEEAGLAPAAEAPLDTLLRRATFDLTGLPPTPGERAAFLDHVETDGFDAAWSALLDRLFASPHYGEHQARHWLDLVRYGETNGYERDAQKKNVWRYRDWVVRAFENDLPYDRFAQLQLAGDELVGPDAPARERSEALLATGFHRLGVWDDEPADRRQAAADEIADIVDTTSQVFMATTMGCARCHDHKADPIAQTEYYGLTASFAGLLSNGAGPTLDIVDPDVSHLMTVAERDRRLADVDARIAQEVERLGLGPKVDEGGPRTLVPSAREDGGAALWRYREGEVANDWRTPAFDDADWSEGRGGFGTEGTPNARVGTRWDSSLIHLRTTFRLDSIPSALRLTVHHDEDVAVFLNGVRVFRREGYVQDYFNVQLDGSARDALVVGRNVLAVRCRQTGGGQFVDVGLDTVFDPDALRAQTVAAARAAALEPESERTRDVRALLAERDALEAEPVAAPYPAQVVKERGPVAPPQYVHMRGSVHAEGELVEPSVPNAWSFGSAPSSATFTRDLAEPTASTTGRRRALALWLFDGGAHLAARVEANRTWQFLFGRGLCRSPGDFGRLGERPTHPELLDRVAAELIAKGWSRKRLQRWLMETRAYRMSSVTDAATVAADPRNDLFARFSPRRLTAEEFRDATLFVSGELVPKRFGPSVFPPLPAEVLATASRPDAAWGRSTPEDAARRSLYVHVKRSLREPLLAALDQPDPDLPCPDRFPTNVPTQALLTLNGEFTGARAQAFAESVAGAAEGRDARVSLAIARALGRDPASGEVERAVRLVTRFETEHGLGEERALALFLLGLLNRNEFIWLD